GGNRVVGSIPGCELIGEAVNQKQRPRWAARGGSRNGPRQPERASQPGGAGQETTARGATKHFRPSAASFDRGRRPEGAVGLPGSCTLASQYTNDWSWRALRDDAVGLTPAAG